MNKKRLPLLIMAATALLLAGCLTVGDIVWLDENGNGIQDPGEPGVEGVEVALHNLTTDLIDDTDVTDAAGLYNLSKGFPGTQSYTIEFTAPSGYEFTLQNQGSDDELDSDAHIVTGQTPSFTGTDSGAGYDAGLIEEVVENNPPADTGGEEQTGPVTTSVTGYVWIDADHDGLQDEDEQPLEGVGVNLILEGEDSPIQQTLTDANGLFQFDDVEADLSYFIAFDAPTDYMMTLMDQGSDDAVDSDADEDSEETPVFALTAFGAEMDAGYYLPASAQEICYGPTAEDFPNGISPLSGLEVSNPEFLHYRPLFLSISIFPASVRPPTGLGVSPQVFQIYIGDGETRLMTAFYGEFPEKPYAGGDEGSSSGQPEDASLLVGDRVWYDSNGNGLQDEGEPGVPGIPVTLFVDNHTYAQTTTDGGGYYYFDYSDVEPDSQLQIFFDVFSVQPNFYFVTRDVGDDDTIDSDSNGLGYTAIYQLADGLLDDIDLSVDAGVRESVPIVGLRSGRVAYQDVQGHYCGCLVTAGADPNVAAQINTCANAFGDINDIGSAGLDVLRLEAIAAQSSEQACADADIAANLFCTSAPSEGGTEANQLWMEYSRLNTSKFIFNGEGAYNWYINGTTDDTEDEFTLMTDGLTGEVLTFENVVVMQISHSQDNSAGTIFSLDMDFQSGKAYYLRNGMLYEGTWTTLAREDFDINSENLPPVRFLDENGDPFAFAPGQIWINTVNTGDNLRPGAGAGEWEVDFDAPAYNP